MANRTSALVMLAVGGLLISARVDAAAPLPSCTIDMDAGCPNIGAGQCGATYSGGGGCTSIGAFNCYSSGVNSYSVTVATPLTITFSDDATSLDVFFAHQQVGASGEMRFFDAVVGGNEVGSPLLTNGPCQGAAMPAMQQILFSTAVRRIEVTAFVGTLWIDDFAVNTIPFCGNGVVDAGEECDDMNMVSGDGCSAFCTDETPIPTVNEWGMFAMLGLTLVAGTLLFRNNRRLPV